MHVCRLAACGIGGIIKLGGGHLDFRGVVAVLNIMREKCIRQNWKPREDRRSIPSLASMKNRIRYFEAHAEKRWSQPALTVIPRTARKR